MHMDSYKNTNDTTYQPLKPVVCRFFKPKIKTQTVSNSNENVQTNKPALYIDLDDENPSDDIPNKSSFFSKCINGSVQCPTKTNESKVSSENESGIWKQNAANLSPQSIKIETSPCEMDTAFVSLSSVESSSLSNFPQFSAPYSKSIQSLSDTEMHEPSVPTPTPALAPIVTGVYSLNKAYRSPTNPPKRRHSTSDVKDPTTTEQFLVDLTDDEEFQKITNIFQIVKQVVPSQPAQLADQWDLHSIDSGSLTEPMVDDRDELDGSSSVFQPLLQPSIVLEAIELAHLPKRTRRSGPKSEHLKETATKASRSSEEPKEISVRASPRFDKRKTSTLKTSRCSETSRTNESATDSLANAQEQNDLQSDCVILGEEKLPPKKIRRHSRSSRQIRMNQKEKVKVKLFQSGTNSNLNDKKYIYCFRCQKNYLTLCEKHSVTWILNDDIECPHVEYVVDGTYDKFYRDRRLPGEEKKHCQCQKNELEHIQMGMPREFSLRESKDSVIGVWTTIALNLGTIIGPYLGEIAENWPNHERTRSRRAPNVTPSKSEMSCLQYAFKSNWLRYINFTSDIHKANLKITIYENKTFYQTVKIIYPETELFVCKKIEYGIPSHQKLSNISSKAHIFSNKANPASEDISKSTKLSEPLTCSSASRTSDQIASSITIFDKDQLQYLGHLLLTTPSLGCPALNSLMRARFPDNAAVSDSHIDRVIRSHRLRPLCGLKSGLASRSEIEEIVELYRERPRLTLVDCQKILARRFPNRPLLDLRSIDRIVELNHCRNEGPECGPEFRVDKDILSETRSILTARPKLDTANLVVLLTRIFPEKRNMLSRAYLKFLINKFHLRRTSSNSADTTISKTSSLSTIKKISLSGSKTGSVSADKTDSISASNPKSVSTPKTSSLPQIKKISKSDSVSESKTDSASVNKSGYASISKAGLTTLPCTGSVPVSKLKSVTLAETDLFNVSKNPPTLPKSNSLVIAKSSISKDNAVTQHRASSINISNQNSAAKTRSCSMDDQMKAFVRSICLEDPTMSAPCLNSKLRIEMPSKPVVSDRVVLNAIRSIRLACRLGKD